MEGARDTEDGGVRFVRTVRLPGWGLVVCEPFGPFRYLVDPASSYMLVLKIKPCMSKHMP